MQNIASRNARDLDDAARGVLEGLLGRRLEHEEHVTVMAYPPHPPPSGEQRQRAARRLEKHLSEMRARVTDTPERELEALIDEACDQIRAHQS